MKIWCARLPRSLWIPTYIPACSVHSLKVNARPDLISFEFEEKVTFEVQLPDNYPAYPPNITYRSVTRPGDANRFDQTVIEKYTTPHGEHKTLRVTIPLLKHKDDTAWSRTCRCTS